MVYDMVALRTNPALGASISKLDESCVKCTAVVCGEPQQDPEKDRCPDSAAATLTSM